MASAPLIVHCCHCRWCQRESGAAFAFVRVGTLDDPDVLPPDVHIFTASKQPWVVLPENTPAFAEYYDRKVVWSRQSLERFERLRPLIDAYRARL